MKIYYSRKIQAAAINFNSIKQAHNTAIYDNEIGSSEIGWFFPQNLREILEKLYYFLTWRKVEFYPSYTNLNKFVSLNPQICGWHKNPSP